MVIIARNGLLFLIAWEAMSIASFFLVTFENERESVCRAGWIYLVATHLGTVFSLPPVHPDGTRGRLDGL